MAYPRRAFTLIEVLLVVSLLAVLAAFLWPDFRAAGRSQQLDESARRVSTLIAMCRAEAMNKSRLYQIAIRTDGSVKLRQQTDPIQTPQLFGPVRDSWAQDGFLLQDVWVESIVPLPEGPPPVLVTDRLIQYGDSDFDLDLDKELEPIRVEELARPVAVEFRPDGTCDSLRWTLRDVQGHGVEMTLDGRLGRVTIVPVEALDADSAERPPAIDENRREDEEWDAVDEEPFR